MRSYLRSTIFAGLAAATFCLAPLTTNDASAQGFSFSFGSRGTTSRYYNGYGRSPYTFRNYGYTDYGRHSYGRRYYGHGRNGVYAYPSINRYGRSGIFSPRHSRRHAPH